MFAINGVVIIVELYGLVGFVWPVLYGPQVMAVPGSVYLISYPDALPIDAHEKVVKTTH